MRKLQKYRAKNRRGRAPLVGPRASGVLVKPWLNTDSSASSARILLQLTSLFCPPTALTHTRFSNIFYMYSSSSSSSSSSGSPPPPRPWIARTAAAQARLDAEQAGARRARGGRRAAPRCARGCFTSTCCRRGGDGGGARRRRAALYECGVHAHANALGGGGAPQRDGGAWGGCGRGGWGGCLRPLHGLTRGCGGGGRERRREVGAPWPCVRAVRLAGGQGGGGVPPSPTSRPCLPVGRHGQ